MAYFHITPGVPSVNLPSSRKGQVSFTVTNNLGRAARIQASIRPDDEGEAKWLSIDGEAERDLAPDETETFLVQVLVPASVPGGEHRFRLLVASVTHPDDEYDTSPEVAFTIPAAQAAAPFPWWIVAAAAGVLLIAGGGYLVFRALSHPRPPPITDAGVCAEWACGPSDGCCPPSCTEAQDVDCHPGCGNGRLETGEVCDDGNTTAGDNCDPTCQYFDTLTRFSGSPGSESFADGTGKNARYESPSGMCSDGTYLYVTDINDHTIRRVAPYTGETTTVAGLPRHQDPKDGPISQAQFGSPRDCAYVGGKLYVADQDYSEVREIDLDAGMVRTVLSSRDGGISSGLSGLGAANGKLLLVSSAGLQNYDPTNGSLGMIASSATLSAVTYSYCTDVVAWGGDYYLACRTNVVKVSSSGTATAYAGATTGGGCTDGAPTTATFNDPEGIDADSYGIYVADNGCNRIRKVTPTAVTTIAGTTGGYQDDSNAMAAKFDSPHGMVQLQGTLYVADWNNSSVRRVSGGVATLSGLPPSYGVVYGGADVARLPGAAAIAVDAGWAYALGYSPGSYGAVLYRVKLPTRDGAPGAGESQWLHQWPAPGNGVAMIGSDLFVALNDDTIHRVTLLGDGGVTEALYAGVSGVVDPKQDGARLAAHLQPAALATDGQALYFVDSHLHTIRKIANDNVSTLVGTDQATDIVDGTGFAAHFRGPQGLASDGTNLYTFDGEGAMVRRISIAQGAVTTLAGGDAGVFGTADGVGRAARFAGWGTGLATDGHLLFISDPGAGVARGDLNSPSIRALDLSTLQVTTMIGVRGQWTTVDGVGTQTARINIPGPLAFDPAGHQVVLFDNGENVFQVIR